MTKKSFKMSGPNMLFQLLSQQRGARDAKAPWNMTAHLLGNSGVSQIPRRSPRRWRMELPSVVSVQWASFRGLKSLKS